MANVSDAVKAQSKENANKAKQLPPSVQYAIVKVMPNILNGAFWGFDSVKNVQEHAEALRGDQNITLRKIGDSALIEVNPAYMVQAIQVIDANAITQSDINTIKKAQGKAQVEFENFLAKKAKTGNYGGTIGIYCTNDTTSIKFKGNAYPAFRLTINEVLGYLGNYNYTVKVDGNFVSAREAFGAGQPLWDSMTLSPTKTGVFIDIKFNGTADEGKQLYQAFRQKYGKH